MADVKLSSKSTTTTTTSTFIYILVPDGGSPTGFLGYRISFTDFNAYLQAQITSNASTGATNASDISDLQNINFREQRKNQTSDFSIAIDADSTVRKIEVKEMNSSTASFKVGTSLGGDDILGTKSLTADKVYRYDSPIEIDSSTTLYFTIITGKVSTSVYGTKDEFA